MVGKTATKVVTSSKNVKIDPKDLKNVENFIEGAEHYYHTAVSIVMILLSLILMRKIYTALGLKKLKFAEFKKNDFYDTI